jgi:hypothetical protein
MMTMRMIRRNAVHLLLALTAAAVPARVDAQITVAGGARTYDGDDGGSAAMIAVRTEFPIGTAVILEFATSIAERPGGVSESTAGVFEAQIQLPIRLGEVLTPYVGAGGGMGSTYDGSNEGWQAMLAASVGVRAAITPGLGVVLDARARGIGTSFRASHLDLTAGLRVRL